MCRKAFFVLLLAALTAAPAARAEVRVRGFLVSGSEKIAGAAVRLAAAPEDSQRFEMGFAHPALAELARTRSDAGGYFELAAPEKGFYQLQVEAAGYLGADRWVPALRATGDPVAIQLIPARPVRLALLDPEGRPVAGARVRLGFEQGGAGRYPTWPLFRSAAADGSVTLQVPAGQDAAAVLAAPGFASTMAALPAGQAAVEVRLERGRPVEVEAVDPRKRFLPNVVVFAPDTLHEIGRTGRDGRALVRLAAEQRSLGFADAEGRYAIAALPAAAPAAVPSPAAVSSPAAVPASEPLRFVLEDPQPIEGQVFELPERVALADAWVFLGGRPPYFTRSDRQGFFRLPRLRGRRGLVAAKEGYVSGFAEVGALPLHLGIGLEKAATVFGRVTDGAGEPVAGAWVTATAEAQSRSLRAGGRQRAMSDRDGRYTIDDLPADHEVLIEAAWEQLAAKATLEPVAAGESVRADLQLPRRQAWSCRVVDPEAEPLAGAQVFVASPQLEGLRLPSLDLVRLERNGEVSRLGIADAQGRLLTTELAAGSYDIAASAAGHAAVWVRGVEIGAAAEGAAAGAAEGAAEGESSEPAGASPGETIVLQPLVRTQGRVLDEHDAGLAGATVHLSVEGDDGTSSRAGPETQPVAESGERGEFSFQAVAAGQLFTVIAGKEGYVSARTSGQGTGDAAAPPLVVRLSRAGVVAGTVTGDGQPIAFADLRVEAIDLPPKLDDLSWKPRARSDAAGAYVIDRLWPGRYRLRAQSGGFQAWQSGAFELRAGERKQLDVELLKAALVFGKVLLASGEPVEGARLSLAANSTDPPSSSARLPADALGQYRIDSAKPGAGWLAVASDRYRKQGRAVDIGEGVNEIDFVLETGSLEIAGRVLDGGGQPIARARARLYGDSIYREERSGKEGEVRFADLDPGKYRLELAAPGYLGEASPLELESSRKDLVWRLREARSRILGSVLGLDGASLAAIRIEARPLAAGGGEAAAAAPNPRFAAADSRGRYAVENLAAGAWLLIASSSHPARVLAQRVEIGEGEQEVEQDLDFGRLVGPWTGRLHAAGQPQSGYFFTLSHPELGPLLQGSGTDDRLELQAEAGTYRLEIFSAQAPDHRQELNIEIGAPIDQPVDLGPP